MVTHKPGERECKQPQLSNTPQAALTKVTYKSAL